MWIFKDDNDNIVTCFSHETYDRTEPNLVGKASDRIGEIKYMVVDFFLEDKAAKWKKGFIFTISDTADQEDWINTIKRFHPTWKIKPYKVIEVEWE